MCIFASHFCFEKNENRRTDRNFFILTFLLSAFLSTRRQGRIELTERVELNWSDHYPHVSINANNGRGSATNTSECVDATIRRHASCRKTCRRHCNAGSKRTQFKFHNSIANDSKHKPKSRKAKEAPASRCHTAMHCRRKWWWIRYDADSAIILILNTFSWHANTSVMTHLARSATKSYRIVREI